MTGEENVLRPAFVYFNQPLTISDWPNFHLYYKQRNSSRRLSDGYVDVNMNPYRLMTVPYRFLISIPIVRKRCVYIFSNFLRASIRVYAYTWRRFSIFPMFLKRWLNRWFHRLACTAAGVVFRWIYKATLACSIPNLFSRQICFVYKEITP